MIRVYETVLNDTGVPELQCIKQINAERNALSIRDTAHLLKDELYIATLVDEHVYLVGYNQRLEVVGIFPVSIGDYSSSGIYNRKIVDFIVLSGATSFVIFHNHSSQILIPSKEDCDSVAILRTISALIQTDFMGSFIISKAGWISVEEPDIIHAWDEEEEDFEEDAE